MSFLNAHRDTILGLLRDPVGKIPLSTIKELHLLATIFTQVLPTVESQDLGLSSGFGAYHNALLHLASRFFLREKWEDLTVPLNDAERADAEKPAPSGKQNGSLFDYNTDNAVEDLNASLLSYFVLATETRGSAPLRPVFTPSVSTRETGLLPKGAFLTPPLSSSPSQLLTLASFRSSGGGPSVLSAVVLLYETVSYLRTTVDQFASVSDKIAQPKMLTNDEIEEIVLASRATEDLPAKFSAAQSHRLAVQVLVKTQASLKKRAALSLRQYLLYHGPSDASTDIKPLSIISSSHHRDVVASPLATPSLLHQRVAPGRPRSQLGHHPSPVGLATVQPRSRCRGRLQQLETDGSERAEGDVGESERRVAPCARKVGEDGTREFAPTLSSFPAT